MVAEPRNERGDFFASLVEDHARIETRLAALEIAAQAVSRSENDAAALGVIRGTLAFFATEAARHEAHEESTLFPRLRSLPELEPALRALKFQHQMNEAARRDLSACVERFAPGSVPGSVSGSVPGSVPGSGRELCRLALRFAELHRAHALAEERALFPLAAARLSPQVIAEMGREMRERTRGAGPSVEGLA